MIQYLFGSKQQTCASTGIKERVLCHDHQHIQNSLLRCTNLVIGEKCIALGTKNFLYLTPSKPMITGACVCMCVLA